MALRAFITLGAEAEETEIVVGTTNNHLYFKFNYKILANEKSCGDTLFPKKAKASYVT